MAEPTAAPDESLAEPTAAPDESLAEPTAAPLEEEADDVPLALPSGPGDASGSGNARAEPPSPLPQASEGAAGADSFGEGLDGDSDALIPAILWSLAALAIWLSANFAGRRWRKIPTYALSTLPFLVVMFMAFWHIDRILPSY